jgi:hypothetical protein
MECGGLSLRHTALGILVLWTVFMQAALADAQDRCAPWPGEPRPLPATSDADPIRARWAELRAAELVRLAQRAEPEARRQRQRLWRRVLCLDPDNEPARRGVARTRPVQIHRPAVRWGEPGGDGALATWSSLVAAIAVPRIAPPAPPVPRPQDVALTRAETLLVAGEESLAHARFQEALGRALAAREALDTAGAADAARPLHVRAEVTAATAQVALGDEEAARASFARALAFEPQLALDPALTSPKVLRVLEAARSAADSGEGT